MTMLVNVNLLRKFVSLSFISLYIRTMCDFPRYVRDTGETYPCGTCPKCLVRRTDAWIFRILQEEKFADSSIWIRLSYDNDHLPISSHGWPTLSIRDVQLFLKRLRKRHTSKPMWRLSWNDYLKDFVYKRNRIPFGNKPIKYYVCGEYGSRFHRPHYHLCLLNVDEAYLHESWRDDEGFVIGDIFIADDTVNASNIGYTVGYMNKTRYVFKGDKLGRQAEFALMSKKMGLSYLTPAMIDWHLRDYSRGYITLPNGKRSAMPRYLRQRLYGAGNGVAYDIEHRVPITELTELPQYEAKSKQFQDAFIKHVQLYGSGDDFIRSQNEARRAAVLIFQSKSNSRTDV